MKILILLLFLVNSAFAENANFSVGDANFAPGDNILITAVHGAGKNIMVEGTYKLASHEEALLALSITTPGTGMTSWNAKQKIKITKGSGNFNLRVTVPENGKPHVSFYPVNAGATFGGVYFSQR